MTLYEEKFNQAKENYKIVFYDYLTYKREIGWYTVRSKNDWHRPYSDWHRPYKIKKAKYNADFLNNLPDYYFLGFPIKDLIKFFCSNGACHICAFALSLYFNEFEIVTCNLSNYNDYYNKKHKNNRSKEFEHSFLVVSIDNKKCVIDTTWGMITDYDTYKNIFAPDNIRIVSSKNLESNDVYNFIKERKNISDSSKYDTLSKYLKMCKDYRNSNDKILQDFINRCLVKTSDHECMGVLWRRLNNKIDYPVTNMISIDDDEFDFTLNSAYTETKERNKRVLASYHMDENFKKLSVKQKVLTLFEKLIDC